MIMFQKVYSKMNFSLRAKTHHEVRIFEVDGLIWNKEKTKYFKVIKQHFHKIKKDFVFGIS